MDMTLGIKNTVARPNDMPPNIMELRPNIMTSGIHMRDTEERMERNNCV